MNKLEQGMMPSIFQQKKTLSIETITHSFDVIRIYLTDSGINEIDEHLDQIEAIKNATENDVIEVHTISCGGGLVNTIVPLCNALASTQAHTVCYVEGHCASAGTFPSMICDQVFVGAYSSFMLHCASGGTGYGTMVNSAESAKFFEKQYTRLLDDIYTGFVTSDEAKMLHDGREIYLDSEAIQERLERRAQLLQEQAEEEECSPCDDTCSSLDNPCKECHDLPEIVIPAKEEEEVVVKPPARKRPTKKKASVKP